MQEKEEVNFGLSQEEFEQLEIDLRRGDDALFKQIFLSQVEESIQYVVRRFRADYNEAYDCVLDTLVKFHRRIAERKVTYGNLRFLFTRMATQEYQAMKKKESKMRVVEEDFASLPLGDTYSDEQLEKLEAAWAQLGDECKKILKMNYYMGLNLAEISEITDKSHASIRKQKQRCKEALKKFYFLNQ